MNSSRGASTRVGRETKLDTKLPYVNPNIKNTANAQTNPRETEHLGRHPGGCYRNCRREILDYLKVLDTRNYE